MRKNDNISVNVYFYFCLREIKQHSVIAKFRIPKASKGNKIQELPPFVDVSLKS